MSSPGFLKQRTQTLRRRHEAGNPVTPRGWRIGLGAVLAVALVALGGAVAVLLGLGATTKPSADSVDAGFARDMSVHHRQAVLMAGLARDRSTDPEVRLIAFDIETLQLSQVGQMQGWLALWELSQSSGEPMSWMAGHDHGATTMDMSDSGLMPGMASATELDQLRQAQGADFDVLFLQLMIRHHQGGTAMAAYAAEHAEIDAVRTLARSMDQTQTVEITTLTDMLTARGGTPLAAP